MYYGSHVSFTLHVGVHRKPLYALGAPLSQGDSDVVNKLLKSVEIFLVFCSSLMEVSRVNVNVSVTFRHEMVKPEFWDRVNRDPDAKPKIESNLFTSYPQVPILWGTFRLTNRSNKG